jgi:hypothetical protein
LERARSQSRNQNYQSLGLDSGGSRGESESHGIAKREVVLDSEFMDLPETTPATGLSGYFLSPTLGAFRDCIPGDWIARHLTPADQTVPDSLRRPESDEYLQPWEASDAELLCLAPVRPTSALYLASGTA